MGNKASLSIQPKNRSTYRYTAEELSRVDDSEEMTQDIDAVNVSKLIQLTINPAERLWCWDPYGTFSHPLPNVHNVNKTTTDEKYFGYRRLTRNTKKNQLNLIPAQPFFINDHSAQAMKLKRRMEMFTDTEDGLKALTIDEKDIYMRWNFANEHFEDYHNLDARRCRSESNLTELIECYDSAKEVREELKTPGLVYSNNQRNKDTAKDLASIVHIWFNQAEKYRNDPEEDPDGDFKFCLEILPRDPEGTMCIVREYYRDSRRLVGPILHSLEKAATDGYDLIIVEPQFLTGLVGGWIQLATRYQKIIATLSCFSIYKCLTRPQDRLIWGTTGWLSIVFYMSYRFAWERDPLAKYDYWVYNREHELAEYMYPDGHSHFLKSLHKRCNHFERFKSCTLLNRHCLFLTKTRFPKMTFKFITWGLRSSCSLTFLLMVWRTGWPYTTYCKIPCKFVPLLDADGEILRAHWKWVSIPRPIEIPKDFIPRSVGPLYRHVVHWYNNGAVYGVAAAFLIWYNWFRRPRRLTGQYYDEVFESLFPQMPEEMVDSDPPPDLIKRMVFEHGFNVYED